MMAKMMCFLLAAAAWSCSGGGSQEDASLDPGVDERLDGADTEPPETGDAGDAEEIDGEAAQSGFARVTVETARGERTVVLPRYGYTFEATGNVYYLAAGGDDSADGSIDRPWATFERALPALQAGDVLYVRGGDYPTPFGVGVSGEAGSPIVISAYPGERARIYQPEGWQAAHVNDATVTLGGVSHVWLHGFVIEGCLGQPGAPPGDIYGQNGITISGGGGEGVRVLNNEVSKAQHCGIKEMGHGGTHFLIEGNVIYDNGLESRDHGIYIPSLGAVIRGNAVFGNAGYGIHLYESPSGCHVYDNVVFENQWGGIIVSGPGNTVAHNASAINRAAGLLMFRGGCTGNFFVNNILIDNAQGQIAMDDGGGAYEPPSENLIDYNAVFPIEGWASPAEVAGWTGGHMFIGDPAVVSHYDLRVEVDSPCRGSAGEVTLNGALPWPDMGLFPATLYVDPAW